MPGFAGHSENGGMLVAAVEAGTPRPGAVFRLGGIRRRGDGMPSRLLQTRLSGLLWMPGARIGSTTQAPTKSCSLSPVGGDRTTGSRVRFLCTPGFHRAPAPLRPGRVTHYLATPTTVVEAKVCRYEIGCV